METVEVEVKKVKILLVDDSPYNLFIINQMISSLSKNYEISETINGHEVIDLLKYHENVKNETFQYIFLDLYMPLICGYELAKEIRERSKKGEINLN